MYDFEKNKLKASHHQLQAIADFFSNDKRDFIEHEGWFCKISDEYDMLLGALFTGLTGDRQPGVLDTGVMIQLKIISGMV